jgi:hypothetical protein
MQVNARLRLNLSQYPFFSRILQQTYENELIYSHHSDGAHDANWVKEYEFFYNKQPHSTPYVRRIFLKRNEPRGKPAGFVDIRPVSDGSEVSESYLVPPKSLSPDNNVYLNCLGTYTEYGQHVHCVPYIMPDSIFGMCIHGSLWIAIKVLENLHTIERAVTIPEIQTLVRGHPYTDKEGLPFKQAARILRMSRTHAFYIQRETPDLDDSGMLMELFAYVESGLPVIVGVSTQNLPWWTGAAEQGYHSIVAIGNTIHDNKIEGFVFHDESALPYQKLSNDALLKAWHDPKMDVRELLVAVPPSVTLQFSDAFQEFAEMLTLMENRGLISVNVDEIRIRPLLLMASNFVFVVYGAPSPITQLLYRVLRESDVAPSGYLWVIFWFGEHDNRNDPNAAKGFFARDATRETDFRMLFMRETKTAIYQAKGTIYQRREDRKNRKRL